MKFRTSSQFPSFRDQGEERRGCCLVTYSLCREKSKSHLFYGNLWTRGLCGDDDVLEDQISPIFFSFCKNFANTGWDHYSKVIKRRLIGWGWFWLKAQVSSAWSLARATVSAPLLITRHHLVNTTTSFYFISAKRFKTSSGCKICHDIIRLRWYCGQFIKSPLLNGSWKEIDNSFKFKVQDTLI